MCCRGGIHHIIHAETGEPISDKQSVTVIAKDGFWADYYATYLFLLPMGDCLSFVNSVQDLESMIIDSVGTPHFSDNMQKFID